MNLQDIYPVLQHLKLFLKDEDMGAMALVSTSLNYSVGQVFKDYCLYILMHILIHSEYLYDNKINLKVNDENFIVCIPRKIIAHKQLRLLMGREEYFKKYTHIFFKDDLVYLSYNNGTLIGSYSSVCVFCEKPNLDQYQHEKCMMDYYKTQSPIKYDGFEEREYKDDCRNWIANEYTILTNYICPELEQHTIKYLDKNIFVKMDETCRGNPSSCYGYERNTNCAKCGYRYQIHKHKK
jgi:hypothetical protein